MHIHLQHTEHAPSDYICILYIDVLHAWMDIAAWERLLEDRAFYMQMDVFYSCMCKRPWGNRLIVSMGSPSVLSKGHDMKETLNIFNLTQCMSPTTNHFTWEERAQKQECLPTSPWWVDGRALNHGKPMEQETCIMQMSKSLNLVLRNLRNLWPLTHFRWNPHKPSKRKHGQFGENQEPQLSSARRPPYFHAAAPSGQFEPGEAEKTARLGWPLGFLWDFSYVKSTMKWHIILKMDIFF